MEGGTDFDLQVLEVPVAPAAAGGDGGGGGGDGGAEKSQGDPRGGNTQTGLEVKRSVMEEGGETKDSDKVKKTGSFTSSSLPVVGCSDWCGVFLLHQVCENEAKQNGEEKDEEEEEDKDEGEEKTTKKVSLFPAGRRSC